MPDNIPSIPLNRRRKYYILGGIICFFIALLIVARLYLDNWVLHYVNRTLSDLEGYQGSVESINIELYRGAYQINNLKINKKTGDIPVPFLDIEKADISIQWGALIKGRIVSDIILYKPIVNFAISKSGNAAQTGAEADWIKAVKDLTPVDINYVTFNEGKLTYIDYSSEPRVNIFIHNMAGEVRNLRNVDDENNPLPSHLIVGGDSIGGGKLKIAGDINILRKIPDMDIDTKLEGVNLPALSDFSEAYAAVDIERGNLNVYSRLIVKNNQVSGYVKPIASDISIISLEKTNPVNLVWETLVASVMQIFTNIPKDQFATKIDLEGNLDNIETNIWSAIGGIIRNAFIESFKKGLDPE